MIFYTTLNKLRFLIGSYSEIISRLTKLANQKKTKIILPCSLNDLALNYHKVNYQPVDICITDGSPLVWWFSLKLRKKIEKVRGTDMMFSILDNLKTKPLKHYFLSAEKETQLELKKKINEKSSRTKNRFKILPKSASVATENKIINQIIKEKPDVVWIGIGSPKQIELASKIKSELNSSIIFCVGAAFDFITQKKPSAPSWIKKIGLEWFFRLACEPRRLWKRYLITIPYFLLRVTFNWLKSKKNKIFLSLLSLLLTTLLMSIAINIFLKKTIDEPYAHWTTRYSTFTPKYIFWQNFTFRINQDCPTILSKNESFGINQECPKKLSNKESLLRLPIRKYNFDQDEHLSLLFLGDSFSTAVYAEKGYFDYFSEGLSSSLTQKSIESMILASTGSGNSQQFAKFSDTVVKLNPDIVIWQFYWNDFYDNTHLPIYRLKNNKLYRRNAWKNTVFLAGFLNQNIPFLKNSYLGKFISDRSFHLDLFHDWVIRNAKDSDTLEYNKKFIPAIIEQMEALSQEYEFGLYLTLSPLECQQVEDQVCLKNVELFQNELREILKSTGRFVSMEEFDNEYNQQLDSRNKIDKISLFYSTWLKDRGFRHLSEDGEEYYGEILFSNFKKL